MTATPKRTEYDRLAREALNRPDHSEGAASEQEKALAKRVVDLSLKAQSDLSKLPENKDRTNDIRQLHEIFKGLDPATTERVIAEANKTLKTEKLRVAQSAAGEIYLGSKIKTQEAYILSARLKDAPCAPSV